MHRVSSSQLLSKISLEEFSAMFIILSLFVQVPFHFKLVTFPYYCRLVLSHLHLLISTAPFLSFLPLILPSASIQPTSICAAAVLWFLSATYSSACLSHISFFLQIQSNFQFPSVSSSLHPKLCHLLSVVSISHLISGRVFSSFSLDELLSWSCVRPKPFILQQQEVETLQNNWSTCEGCWRRLQTKN